MDREIRKAGINVTATLLAAGLLALASYVAYLGAESNRAASRGEIVERHEREIKELRDMVHRVDREQAKTEAVLPGINQALQKIAERLERGIPR